MNSEIVVFDLGKVLVDFDYTPATRKIAARSQEKYSGLMSGLNLPPGMKLPF